MALTLQEAFIELVNTKNPGLGLTLADVDFGNPIKYIAAEGDVRNTALTLTSKAESQNFTGSKEYHYRRFDYTHPNGEDTYTMMVTDVVSYWDDNDYVLLNFNQFLFDYPLTVDEITVTEIGTGTDGSGDWTDIKVTIDPNHLKWTGAFVFRVYNGKDNLQTKNGELGGF